MPDTPYFTVEEFQAAYPNDDEVAALSDEQIETARAIAEEIIEGLETEDGCHQAFVPRTESFDLDSSLRITIPRYRVRSIESITVDGDELDIEGLQLVGNNIIGLSWSGPIDVTVVHGWSAPPAQIKAAAITLAFHRAVKGPIDDRATGRLSPEGSVITLSTPGLRGAITGIPEVDSAIAQYRKKRIRPTAVWIGEPSEGGGPWRDGVWP